MDEDFSEFQKNMDLQMKSILWVLSSVSAKKSTNLNTKTRNNPTKNLQGEKSECCQSSCCPFEVDFLSETVCRK